MQSINVSTVKIWKKKPSLHFSSSHRLAQSVFIPLLNFPCVPSFSRPRKPHALTPISAPHARSQTRSHAQSHARSRARSHTRSHAKSQSRSHALSCVAFPHISRSLTPSLRKGGKARKEIFSLLRARGTNTLQIRITEVHKLVRACSVVDGRLVRSYVLKETLMTRKNLFYSFQRVVTSQPAMVA